MKLRRLLGWGAALLLALGTAQAAEPQRPVRIVALSPALAEVAAELLEGAIDRLVGVTDYADTPVSLKKIPSVGSYSRFSLEKVVSLKPDLVLGTEDGNPRDQIEHLRSLGKRVVVVKTLSLDEVARSFEIIGDAVGFPERGRKLATDFRAGLAELVKKSQLSSVAPGRKIALQLGDDPLIFIGGHSFTGDLVQRLGFAQRFSDAQQTYPRPSREGLLKDPPDEIWVLALGGDVKPFQKMLDRWKSYSFSQGKTPVLRLIVADDWVRPTPRLLRAGASALEFRFGIAQGGGR